MSDAVILKTSQLSKSYLEGPKPVEVLKNLDFQIEKSERVAIIGSSGSGKSTLLHCLSGLDKATSGDIWFENKNYNQLSDKQRAKIRNLKMGFIYQFHHLLPEFSAIENVMMPLFIAGVNTVLATQKATEMLTLVGLEHRLNHQPSELSGGERQRTAMARALVHHPACLFADEPTGNLDSVTAKKSYQLMMALNQEFQTSLIVVTHDIQLAEKMDQVYTLQDGSFL